MKRYLLILIITAITLIDTTSAFSLRALSAQIFTTPKVFSLGANSLNSIFDYEQAFRMDGDALLSTGEYQKALEKYEQSLALVPYKFETLYNKACAQALLGQKAQALQTLQLSALIHNYAIDLAIDDPDLESIKDMPGFKELIQWKE